MGMAFTRLKNFKVVLSNRFRSGWVQDFSCGVFIRIDTLVYRNTVCGAEVSISGTIDRNG